MGCHRSGLKKSAHAYASMLVRPEYINDVDPKYKKKLDAIVRRPNKSEAEEGLTPCPVCGTDLFETQLDCLTCQNYLPFCIASGRHVVLDDWCECPSCHFPAIYSRFVALLENTSQCPMCGDTVVPDQVRHLDDPRPRLLNYFEHGTFRIEEAD